MAAVTESCARQLIAKLLNGRLRVTLVQRNSFGSTSICCVSRKHRVIKPLPENPNGCGPLTNLPDFSYMDDRPTELSVGQNRRLVKQQQYAETVIQLSKEIDFAVERHKLLQEKKEESHKFLLESKLKPKGNRYLKP